MLLLLLVLLVYMNARIARKKGLNPILWSLITVVAFIVAYLILGGVYLSFVYKGALTKEAITTWAMQSPLVVYMMFLLGVGGMLAVRFVLERKRV